LPLFSKIIGSPTRSILLSADTGSRAVAPLRQRPLRLALLANPSFRSEQADFFFLIRPDPAPSFRTKQADFFFSSDLTPHRHFERSRPTFSSSSDLSPHRHFERSRPTFSSASDLSPHRHFERSRPTFSSAFAPANASACAERNLSSLRSLYAPPPRAPASPHEKKSS
jgi:hypothetical protein